jgi:hypothetical protein
MLLRDELWISTHLELLLPSRTGPPLVTEVYWITMKTVLASRNIVIPDGGKLIGCRYERTFRWRESMANCLTLLCCTMCGSDGGN